MSSGRTDFLYPFIDGDERDATSLLSDLARSAESKADESRRLRAETLARCAAEIDAIASVMSERFAVGGRLFTFGNGGSATDAAATASLFTRPPSGRGLPARSLAADEAAITALGNDVGFSLVFSRQLIAHARDLDMAMGFSTSGSSDNIIAAFGEARRRGLLTIGLAGYEGGQMTACDDLDHCLVVRSDSVHRIQEAQDAVVLALWTSVQRHLGPAAAP